MTCPADVLGQQLRREEQPPRGIRSGEPGPSQTRRSVQPELTKNLVDVPFLELPADRVPDDRLRNVPGVAIDGRERESAHDVDTLEAPFFATHSVAVANLQGIRIEDIGRKSTTDKASILVGHDRRDAHEAVLVSCWNRVPERLEALHGVRLAGVIGRHRDKEASVCLATGGVPGPMESLVVLIDVPDGKRSDALPATDQLRGSIGGLVVDDQPLEVGERLGQEALERPVQRVGAVPRWREHRECECGSEVKVGHKYLAENRTFRRKYCPSFGRPVRGGQARYGRASGPQMTRRARSSSALDE